MAAVISRLAGEWRGEESIAATRWGPGGHASALLSVASKFNGRALVQDYRQERDSQPSWQVHAVFVVEPDHDQYSLYWFDSHGFVPGMPAPGVWDGERLIFVRSSPRGQTRHVYVFEGEDAFSLRLESSFDGGVKWEEVMRGIYRRL